MRLLHGIVALSSVAALLSVGPQVTAASAANPPLVVIVLENLEYSQIVSNIAPASYLNCGGTYGSGSSTPGFICQGTLFENSFSAQHPSLPNYLDLTTGEDNGCLTDTCPAGPNYQQSLFAQLSTSAISFNSLDESMPSPCYALNKGTYTPRHNPEVYDSFADPSLCSATDLPVTTAFPAADSWPPLQSFSLITPNLCHDAHGSKSCVASTGPAETCTSFSGQALAICNADNWLAVNVPVLLAQTPQPIIVITTDEGRTPLCADGAHACGGHTMTAMVGPGVKVGQDLSGPYSDFSLLRGIEGFFGLPCLQNACAAIPISIPEATADTSQSPGPPGAITVTATSPTTVGLTWAAASDADGEPLAGYQVERSTNGGPWILLGPPLGTSTAQAVPPLNGAPVSTGTNSFADSSVRAGATYAYSVSAVDPHGNIGTPVISGTPVTVPTTYKCASAVQCAAKHGRSATASVTLKTNVTAGDLLLVVVAASGQSTTSFCTALKSTPTGWTNVTSSPASATCPSPDFNTAMYDQATSTGQTCPCLVSFPLVASEDWTIWVGEYTPPGGTPYALDTTASDDSGSLPATAMNSQLASTSQAGELAVAVLWNDSSLPGLGPVATGTDSGAWTPVDVTAQGGGNWMEVLQKVVSLSGATVGAQDSLTSGAKVRGVVATF
jgi:acid phosphatase